MRKQAKRQQEAQRRAQQKRLHRQRRVGEDRAPRSASRHPAPALSPLLAQREAKGLALLNEVDGYAGIRNMLRELAHERGEWAGYPMPMENNPIIVEPSYPGAAGLMAIGHSAESIEDLRKEAEFAKGKTIVNEFWSSHKSGNIVIWRDEAGKTEWGVHFAVHSMPLQLATLGASDAWGIEQEARAIQLLGTLLRHRQFKQYLLTGMFLEKSERSGVHYLFRKLRPTIAASFTAGHPWRASRDTNDLTMLAALCLHPIAYYSGSWGGAMCPTDDVVAHLMLMRGDEKLFWKRAAQHPPYRPEAGL